MQSNLKIVDDSYSEEKPFDIHDYDFDLDNTDLKLSVDVTIPPEIEIMRNKFGEKVLIGYAKRFLGRSNIKIKEIFYNRDFNLCIEVIPS